MAKIGYARTSSVGQDNGLETQKQLLDDAGCNHKFFEKVSGAETTKREELKRAMEFVQPGDILVVTKIDRLARSISDLNDIIKQLKEKGVSVQFLKENMLFDANEKDDGIKTLLFNILGSFAQFERDLINQRTSEGRERAKQQGKHMGRPSQDKAKIKKALKLYEERESNGMSVNDISKLTEVPRSTIYAEIKKNNIN